MQTKQFSSENVEKFSNQELADIYESLSPRLFRYAMRLIGDQDHAEECVSETFSRFLKAIRNGAGPKDNVQAYLYRVAHNWITDYYRKRTPDEVIEERLPADASEGPVAVMAKDLERERVRVALLRLPDEQRMVIVLRFYEEWAHEEIAAALGKSLEATRALQYRAAGSLRKMLIGPEL
ncbi:MAG TPA: sigma-70 family RNA polymerase sigma factor [Levilinea sp.]|nr:sigma-70 family RNA polymerase sigma factor [Levilinea sp.]